MKNPKFLKLWSKRHLPEELWPHILSTLPVKSLLRFRSVSKSWLFLIDDPAFARLHLTRFNHNRPQTHLLAHGVWSTSKCTLRYTATLKIIATLPFPQTPRNWLIVCSADGLFMLKRNSPPPQVYEYMLWNPSIRKTLILPPSPEISSQMTTLDFGLGFDPFTECYKYVTLVKIRESGLRSVVVYSVGTNSRKVIEFQVDGCSIRWRRSFCFDQHQLYHNRSPNLCFRGVLFGIATIGGSGPLELVSFDLSSEVFASTKLPLEDDCPGSDSYSPVLSLADCGSSLVVINISVQGRGSIWMLEGLGGDRKSWGWCKRYTIASMIPGYDILAGLRGFFYLGKNDEMMLRWTRMVTSYNLETRKEKIIQRKDLGNGMQALPYMESLMLLK